MKTSLIIATYNWPESLELVFLSLLKQTVLPNEILIADDGSTKETKEVIEKYTKQFQSGIKHIWQEDNGFQKTIILNKTIAQATGDYIIQIDGDIVLHQHFIADHIQAEKAGSFIHGSRVFLNNEISQKAINKLFFKFSFLSKGIGNRFNALHSPVFSKLFSSKNNSLKGTRGCNFSFWKQDFITANGYNEDMVGWGKEDTELSVRLMNNGLIKHKLKYLAVCFHLHHNISSREGLNINNTILAETISSNKTSCTNGINKYAIRN